MSSHSPAAARQALRALFRPAFALPLDCFRVLFSIVALVYFLSLYREAGDFSAPDGLLDHALTREMFWYTRLSLFHPGMPLELVQAAFLCACAASLALAAGWHTRAAALVMFLVAVSAYRFNFLVFYWDDGLMHLFMFWLVLLPTGRTLVLAEWLRDRRDAWRRWQQAVVPGAALRCFAWNLALIYFVSGAWKLTSPMWLHGDALLVTLHTPAAYAPGWWSPTYQPLYRIGNYATLVVELLSPLFLILRPGHWAKWALLVLLVGFHVSIIATLRVPYSNAGLLAAIVLLFRHEVMEFVHGGLRVPDAPPRITAAGAAALAFVAVLTAAVTRFVPGLETVSTARYDSVGDSIDSRSVGGLSDFHKALYGALWYVGIAQEYQLFNWIDIRNYTVRYEVAFIDAAGGRRAVEAGPLFPDSARAVLLQAYLHDLVWVRVTPAYRQRLKESLSQRIATRYCATVRRAGAVSVSSRLMRIGRDGTTTDERSGTLMQFDCGVTGGTTLARMH